MHGRKEIPGFSSFCGITINFICFTFKRGGTIFFQIFIITFFFFNQLIWGGLFDFFLGANFVQIQDFCPGGRLKKGFYQGELNSGKRKARAIKDREPSRYLRENLPVFALGLFWNFVFLLMARGNQIKIFSKGGEGLGPTSATEGKFSIFNFRSGGDLGRLRGLKKAFFDFNPLLYISAKGKVNPHLKSSFIVGKSLKDANLGSRKVGLFLKNWLRDQKFKFVKFFLLQFFFL